MLPAVTANPLDLRSWLDEIRELGELKEVRGADWDLELGAISELNVKKDLPPALLFDEIAGYPKGFRVLTCSTSSPARLSSILRLGPQRSHRALVEALRGKPAQWQADAPKYDPVAVKSGAVLENIQRDANVLMFPSPRWHELDGGRYIGTGCSVVTRDFDSDWTNVGTYRVMVVDRNHVALDMVPGKHGRIHYEKHKQAGKRFPVAIVLGGDPPGPAARRAGRGRRARCARGLGARDRRRAHVQRRLDSATLRRPRAAGGAHPQSMRRRRLHVALLGGRRRGHRPVEPAGSDVGSRDAHRPGARHRHHPARHGIEERPDVRRLSL